MLNPNRLPGHRRRKSLAFAALVAALVVACDEEAPTEAEAPDPLDPTAQPRVISTYPPNGGVGPFELFQYAEPQRPHFILRFDKLIDTTRFESRWLRMEGYDAPVRFRPVAPSLTDVLSIVAYDSTTLAPKEFVVGRTYSVTVDTTLSDATGNRPAAPHRFSFVPEPHFRVLDVLYERGEPISAYDRIRVTWNAIPAAGTDASIHFDPPVQGNWTRSGQSWFFSHAEPFAFHTTYSLRVDETAQDLDGNRMAQPFTTTFQVRPFEILATNPRDGWSGVHPMERIFFAVSGPVDTTSVRAAFTIAPPTPGYFVWGTTSFAFYSMADFQPSTQYRVEMSTALRAWDGTALDAPYVLTFTTDSFHIYATEPYDGSSDVALTETIDTRFNMNLDPATIEPAFTIAPQVSGTLTMPDRGVLRFTPDAPLAPSTFYQVTIATSLRAANGAAFLAPQTFSFTTR